MPRRWGETETLRISDLGFRISDLASRHMAAPSLGHYASLSFVVIGREKRAGDTSQSMQMRVFSVGAAFSRDLAI